MLQRIVWGLLVFSVMGCSAIGLNEQNQQATAQMQAVIEGTVNSRLATQDADRPTLAPTTDSTATLAVFLTQMTTDTASVNAQVDATLTALVEPESTATPDLASTIEQIEVTLTQIAEVTADPESTDEPTPDVDALLADAEATLTAIAEITPEPEVTADPISIPSTAGVVVFGTVPIDSDSINSITALAFDSDGNLLVSLRNGDIYRLIDDDGDDSADDATLIFEDTDNAIGQVSGIFVEDTILYVISGEQLSQLLDDDGDGTYDSVTTLTDDLPDSQALLQANNSIVRADDGRYITADVGTGDILLITLGDD